MQSMQFANLTIDHDTMLLRNVPFYCTPHCDARPAHAAIDLIVIHNISLPPGEFGTDDIKDFFCGKLDIDRHPYYPRIAKLKVSSHVLIDRNGYLCQFVPFNKRAWHAGLSQFEGKENCNDFSIGIELEGSDRVSFTPNQYQQLAALIAVLQQSFNGITKDRIVGHCDIAPERKTDPGPTFDWAYLKGILS
jgi:N-acetyl-anhydromuramoyl-L-alanine amidase